MSIVDNDALKGGYAIKLDDSWDDQMVFWL